jgi:MAF protein
MKKHTPLFLKNLPSGRIGVAVSGGVDSLVLLNLLLVKKPVSELLVLHIDHQIRENSFHDAKCVCDFCEKHSIPYLIHTLKKGKKSEEEARNMRYDFLFEMKEKHNLSCIALAHHADDQIETVFLQILRGCASLSPLKEMSETFLFRPLLPFFKEDILAYAKQENLLWTEDETNAENIFKRNFLRNEIFPRFENINTQWKKHFLSFISHQNQWKHLSQYCIDTLFPDFPCSRESFLLFPKAIQQGIIKKKHPSLYAKHIDEVLDMIFKGTGKKQKHQFFLDKGNIYFQEENTKCVLATGSSFRQKLFLQFSLPFEVKIPENSVEENRKKELQNASPEQFVQECARAKAISVYNALENKKPVLAFDTIIFHPKYGIYEKAKNKKEAGDMIRSYSNASASVFTGVCYKTEHDEKVFFEETRILFYEIPESYVDILIKEGKNTAGAMCIEESLSLFVKKIEGEYYNILGMPLGRMKKEVF